MANVELAPTDHGVRERLDRRHLWSFVGLFYSESPAANHYNLRNPVIIEPD